MPIKDITGLNGNLGDIFAIDGMYMRGLCSA